MKPPVSARWLAPILLVYSVLALSFSFSTPLFEASDELWHYPLVQHLAANGLQLPVQDPTAPADWRQEGSQPPLYYLIAAVLTSGIDTSDMPRVRRINPHADIGVILPDGNANMIVHRPGAEDFPWSGTTLAVQVARLFSVVLGAGTVAVTFFLARTLFPERTEVVLGAAALNALLPMFLFISGSVNNDNLSNLLGNGLTLALVLLLAHDQLPRLRWYALIGVLCGAGLLAKLNIGFLIPLVALSCLLLSLRFRSPRPLLYGGLISGGLTIAIAGWWYLRNVQLYGDPTGLNIFLDLVGRRATPASLPQLWAEMSSFSASFWGLFGGMNVGYPAILYQILNAIAAVALLSVLMCFASAAVRRRWSAQRWWMLSIPLLWSIVTFISYLRWTAETPASQGRLIFGALSAIAIWLALGLSWPLRGRARALPVSGLALLLAAAALTAPPLVIRPAYQPPPLLPATPTQAVFRSADGTAIALRPGPRLDSAGLQPGDTLMLNQGWQMQTPASADWSQFVHVLTPDGVIIAQRDLYPGGGRLATSDIAAGSGWENPIAIRIPDTAYAPMPLTIVAGWVDRSTGERMRLADGADTLALGQLDLQPRSGSALPNPLSINFGGDVMLVGYALSDLSPQAGASFTLTLYWQALRPIARDYAIFAQVLAPPDTTLYASSDAQPANWTRPTSTWAVGEIVEDAHSLTVRDDTPPGIYDLRVGVYLQTEPGFPRLRIVSTDGTPAEDFLSLTRMRVLPKEDSE